MGTSQGSWGCDNPGIVKRPGQALQQLKRGGTSLPPHAGVTVPFSQTRAPAAASRRRQACVGDATEFPRARGGPQSGGVLNHQWGAGFAFECGAGWGALWEAGLRRAISDVHRQGPFGLAAIAATRRRSLPLPPAAARCHATRRCLMLCLPTTAINRQGIIWCSWIACHEQNPACSYSTTRPRRCAPVWTAAELGPPRAPGGNDPIPGLTHCCTPGLCACRVKDKQFGNTNLGVMPVPYVRGTAASREQQPVIQPHCSASAADSAG